MKKCLQTHTHTAVLQADQQLNLQFLRSECADWTGPSRFVGPIWRFQQDNYSFKKQSRGCILRHGKKHLVDKDIWKQEAGVVVLSGIVIQHHSTSINAYQCHNLM